MIETRLRDFYRDLLLPPALRDLLRPGPPALRTSGERWLGKKAVADHFDCSVRSIELAIADGCPHARIFGRVKLRASEVEQWLERTGRLIRGGTSTTAAPATLQTPRGQTPKECFDAVKA